MQNLTEDLFPDLLLAQQLAYSPLNLAYANIQKEPESREYGAAEFEINGHLVKFRIAKITPLKKGQFVTLWKREKGTIIPFDVTDPYDFYIISVRKGSRLGHFIFSKDLLYQKGVLSKERKGGKTAFRIYPAWDMAENPQAKKAQSWQLKCFIEITPEVNQASSFLLQLFN